MPKFNQAVADELDALMREIPGAKAGKMFGMPAYKVNGKLAVGIFEDYAVAKLGAARTAELVGKSGVEAFEPNPGRVWKEWVKFTGALKNQQALIEEAVQYVAENS
ncbi:MAG: hypothetical protein ABI835_07620 [Chloroflexota bacterium]